MNTIKRADFMRVLDYLVFEGKYDRALNDRVDTEFTERGFLNEPCLALWLPQENGLEDLFGFVVQEVLLPRHASMLRTVQQRADIGDNDMILYFPGVTLEG
jgi:hypothetical protein